MDIVLNIFVGLLLLSIIICVVMFISILTIFDKSVYKYKILADWFKPELQKPILTKYLNYLEKLRLQENVFIRYYDSSVELNADRSDHNENSDEAAATYSYYIDLHKSDVNQMPRINLVKSDNFEDIVWLHAHELGHHFAIMYDNDYTEERANEYRKIFAEECLTHEELVIIGVSIETFSHTKLDFDLDEERYKIADLKAKKMYKDDWNKKLYGIPAKLFKNYNN
jgi:hypothetical protein